MSRTGEVKASRLRTMLQHAPSVKSRKELVDFALVRFGVTKVTAEGYVDDIIKYIERVRKR